jgi:hypothetical protein
LINLIASPVDFISGPNSLLTPGNLLNEKTGSLIANPFSLRDFVEEVKRLRQDRIQDRNIVPNQRKKGLLP